MSSRRGVDRGDAAARRMLLGLGFHDGSVDDAESFAGLARSASPDRDRAVSVLETLSDGFFSRGDPSARSVSLLFAETDASHSWVVSHLPELSSLASSERLGLVALARAPVRSAGEGLAWAYFVSSGRDQTPGWATAAPSVHLADHGPNQLWYREAADMFRGMSESLGWRRPRHAL